MRQLKFAWSKCIIFTAKPRKPGGNSPLGNLGLCKRSFLWGSSIIKSPENGLQSVIVIMLRCPSSRVQNITAQWKHTLYFQDKRQWIFHLKIFQLCDLVHECHWFYQPYLPCHMFQDPRHHHKSCRRHQAYCPIPSTLRVPYNKFIRRNGYLKSKQIILPINFAPVGAINLIICQNKERIMTCWGCHYLFFPR